MTGIDASRHEYDYNGRRVSYRIFRRVQADIQPDTVLFLGAGQMGPIARRVARLAGPHVLVVEGVPHWEAQRDGSDIAEFCEAYVEDAMRVYHVSPHARLHIIAESQAAPGVMMHALKHPDKIGNVTLVRPLGFTAHTYGTSDKERFKTFQRRAAQTFRQLLPYIVRDPANAIIPLTVLRARLRENAFTYAAKYGAGVSYDATPQAKQLAASLRSAGFRLRIYLAEHDRMFPEHEVRASLDASEVVGADVVVVPGIFHASMAIPAFADQLSETIVATRNT